MNRITNTFALHATTRARQRYQQADDAYLAAIRQLESTRNVAVYTAIAMGAETLAAAHTHGVWGKVDMESAADDIEELISAAALDVVQVFPPECGDDAWKRDDLLGRTHLLRFAKAMVDHLRTCAANERGETPPPRPPPAGIISVADGDPLPSGADNTDSDGVTF